MTPLARRLTAALVTAAGIGAVMLSPANAAAPDPRWETARLINVDRAAHGLASLQREAHVDALAQEWAQHIIETDDYNHRTNLNDDIIPGMWMGGETLAMFWVPSGEPISPSRTVQAWIDSERHHHVLLHDQATFIGVGVSCSWEWCVYVANVSRVNPYWKGAPLTVQIVPDPTMKPVVVQRGARKVRH
ncbi:CAP domain-containing protein [Kineococcus radiotolerans]|nr:CAP domain-containing protein [Kineococcus radiotolerans]